MCYSGPEWVPLSRDLRRWRQRGQCIHSWLAMWSCMGKLLSRVANHAKGCWGLLPSHFGACSSKKFASHIGCEPDSKNEALGARRRYFCIDNIDVAFPVIENAAIALLGLSRAPWVWRCVVVDVTFERASVATEFVGAPSKIQCSETRSCGGSLRILTIGK